MGTGGTEPRGRDLRGVRPVVILTRSRRRSSRRWSPTPAGRTGRPGRWRRCPAHEDSLLTNVVGVRSASRHRQETWTPSKGPRSSTTDREVVGLYLEPPERPGCYARKNVRSRRSTGLRQSWRCCPASRDATRTPINARALEPLRALDITTGDRLSATAGYGTYDVRVANEGDLRIHRAVLSRLVERWGPDNETIRDRLLSWSQTAQSFEISSSLARTPLVQIGVAVDYAPNLEAWLKSFEEAVIKAMSVDDDDLLARAAAALGITEKELDDLEDEQIEDIAERQRFHGLTVTVTD